MVQNFVAELGSLELLEKYLKFSMETALNSCEELAVKKVDRRKKDFTLGLPPVVYDRKEHFPVIQISGWYLPEGNGKKENSYFNGWGPWETFRSGKKTSAIDAAVAHIKEIVKKHGTDWGRQFIKEFGDGYNSGFNSFDGSVGIGYKLESCYCFPQQLAISLVHIYYGK